VVVFLAIMAAKVAILKYGGLKMTLFSIKLNINRPFWTDFDDLS
jgi:hypothetical protein